MVARFAALGAVVLAVVLLVVVLTGGSKEHDYSLMFQNAGQLVKAEKRNLAAHSRPLLGRWSLRIS